MMIRTANDLKELNAALDKCTNEEEYIEGIIRLAEDHDDQLGIFTSSREDEAVMMKYFLKMAA